MGRSYDEAENLILELMFGWKNGRRRNEWKEKKGRENE